MPSQLKTPGPKPKKDTELKRSKKEETKELSPKVAKEPEKPPGLVVDKQHVDKIVALHEENKNKDEVVKGL